MFFFGVSVGSPWWRRPRGLRGDNNVLTAAIDGNIGAVRHLLRTVPGAAAATDGIGRGGRPGAAGGGGPGGRQDSERPLGERLRLPRCRGRFCGETLAVSILSASPPFKVFQWIFGAVLGF